MIARLLDGGPQVLATGGGAFMNPDTRAAIAAKGISVWLKAEFDVLMRRIKRRHDRPLLKTDDPAATLRQLIDDALSGLCAGRPHRAVARGAARQDRRRDRGRARGTGWTRRRSRRARPRRRLRAMTAPLRAQRSDRRQRRARRAQLRHRDRPRPARLARRSASRRCVRAPRSRSSATRPSPTLHLPAARRRGRDGRPARRRPSSCRRARARRCFAIFEQVCDAADRARGSSAAISSSRSAAA